MTWSKYRVWIALAVLAALVGVLLVVVNQRGDASRAVLSERAASLPDVEGDALTEVQIVKPGEAAVVLVKQDTKWRMRSPFDAAVDADNVKLVIDKLDALEPMGIAATKADNHARLDVTDEAAIQVSAKAGDKVVAHLFVGKFKGGSTMVRPKGSDNVIAVKGSIRYVFDREVKDWRNRNIVDLEMDSVKQVVFESENGKYTMVREGEKQWARAQGEPPIDKLSPLQVRVVARAMATLDAVDFADPKLSVDEAGIGDGSPKVTVFYEDMPAEAPKEDAQNDAPVPTRTVVLRLGNETEAESNRFYLKRDDDPIIYTVAKYTAERFRATAETFIEKAAPEKPTMQNSPHNPNPHSAGGEQQLPPEIMKEIRKQMKGNASPH